MLNEQQLSQLMDKLTVPPMGREMIKHIRASNPSRNVEGRAGNVACRFASKKMGCVIQAESHKNELAAIYLWEHDEQTHEFYDQPPQIPLRYTDANGRRHNHNATPDFFVIQEHFIGWVECKTEDKLRKLEQERPGVYTRDCANTWQYLPGIEFARTFGLGFQLRSSAENPPLYVRNLQFLSDYWDQEIPKRYEQSIQALRNKLNHVKRLRIADILQDSLFGDADALYYAITNDQVYVDLTKELLAEQEHCFVYASIDVATILNASMATPTRTYEPVKALNLSPGKSLVWGTSTFMIRVVSNESVHLQAPDGELMMMKREQLERLVSAGEVQGNDILVDTKHLVSEIYLSASPIDFADAVRRSNILKGESGADAVMPTVSARTIRHWKQRQRESVLKYDDPIVGLMTRKSARGNRTRKLAPRVIEIMREVITQEFAGPDAKGLPVCWGSARNRCEAEHLIPPSEKAFRREVRLSMSNYELTRARGGHRAAYSQEPVHFFLDQSTPRHGDRPFEIAHIDHTQLDIQLVGSKFGELIAKPWLSIMLDAYTRKVLACVLLFDPPSYRSCMLLIRDCLRRHSRAPSNIVVDRGSEFHSVYFEILLGNLKITKKSRPPQKARFGSVMERFFGVSNTQLVHNLRGNNKALQVPRQVVETHDPRKRAVWTYETFLSAFEDYVFNIYGELEHPATGVSPNQAFSIGLAKTGMRGMRLVPMSVDTEMLCLPSTKTGEATIIPGRGVKIGYLYYQHALMRNPANARKHVPVRYDPFNIGVGYAYIDGQWRMCESECAALFAGKTERQIMIIAAEINGKNKRSGERRAINAQTIARYLLGAESTQAQLLQQRRDAEQRTTYQEHESTSPSIDLVEQLQSAQAKSWSSITTTQLGEFK